MFVLPNGQATWYAEPVQILNGPGITCGNSSTIVYDYVRLLRAQAGDVQPLGEGGYSFWGEAPFGAHGGNRACPSVLPVQTSVTHPKLVQSQLDDREGPESVIGRYHAYLSEQLETTLTEIINRLALTTWGKAADFGSSKAVESSYSNVVQLLSTRVAEKNRRACGEDDGRRLLEAMRAIIREWKDARFDLGRLANVSDHICDLSITWGFGELGPIFTRLGNVNGDAHRLIKIGQNLPSGAGKRLLPRLSEAAVISRKNYGGGALLSVAVKQMLLEVGAGMPEEARLAARLHVENWYRWLYHDEKRPADSWVDLTDYASYASVLDPNACRAMMQAAAAGETLFATDPSTSSAHPWELLATKALGVGRWDNGTSDEVGVSSTSPAIPGMQRTAGVTSVESISGDFCTDAQRKIDTQLFERAMKLCPNLSVEEIRRRLVRTRPHLTVQHVDSQLRAGVTELQHALERPVDRAGDEPNFLLAAKLAYMMLNAEAGTTYDELLTRFVTEEYEATVQWGRWGGLLREDITALQEAYDFVPRWPENGKTEVCPSWDTAPPEIANKLSALKHVPNLSRVLEKHSDIREEEAPRALEGTVQVSVELDLAGAYAYFHNLIYRQGANGGDIHPVWKYYPESDIAQELAERCFGIKGPKAVDEGDLQSKTKQALIAALKQAQKSGKPLAVHVISVPGIWTWFSNELKKYPDVQVMGISHTTADAIEVRESGLSFDRIALSMMAESQPKTHFERKMFAVSFRDLVGQIEREAGDAIGAIRDRHHLIMGIGGQVIGWALTRALQPQYDFSGCDPRLTKIAEEDRSAQIRKKELDEQKVKVWQPEDLSILADQRKLMIWNCTPKPVLTRDFLDNLSHDLVYGNLGSGQKDLDLLAQMSPSGDGIAKRHSVGQFGTLPVFAYKIRQSSGRIRTVYMLGDGKVLNFREMNPDPESHSAVLYMCKLESWAQARWALEHPSNGKMGPQLLSHLGISMPKGSRTSTFVFGKLGDAKPITDLIGDMAQNDHATWERPGEAIAFETHVERKSGGASMMSEHCGSYPNSSELGAFLGLPDPNSM